jgi:hypothetical protein
LKTLVQVHNQNHFFSPFARLLSALMPFDPHLPLAVHHFAFHNNIR